MASIRKEIVIRTSPEAAWEALSAWGELHERLARGFAVDTRLDGGDRLVTFFTGTVVRERLVDRDDDARRLVWTIVDGPYAHHNGSAQVLDDPQWGTRFVWVADVLPDELRDRTDEMMSRGITAVAQTLERDAA